MEEKQYQNQKDNDHTYDRNNKKDSTPAPERKQGYVKDKQENKARRFYFQSCVAMRADEVRPGTRVKEWGDDGVIAIGTRCHRANSLPASGSGWQDFSRLA
jgi:hypothetical protein